MYVCGKVQSMVINHEHALNHFSTQIEYALQQYSGHGYTASSFHNMVIGGLGGSGIGGRLSRLFFQSEASIPVEVFSEYALPAYANSNTLVVLCSYSGNTEETLAMYEDAKSRGCTIICVAAGGTLMDWAHRDGLKCYQIETGYQPRMALGYGFSFQLLILGELFGMDMSASLRNISERLQTEQDALKTKATALFDFFKESIAHKFVVVCDMAFEAAAIRFCQQIQENAKGEAFVHVLPEANHNVIESYYDHRDTNFIFLNSGLNPRTNIRFDFLKGVLTELQNKVYTYQVSQFNLWALFEFIYVTDWLSIHASNAKGVNNMEVGIIMRLKKHLEQA
jgi:glucose/mannose-6-phosphate isomerase